MRKMKNNTGKRRILSQRDYCFSELYIFNKGLSEHTVLHNSFAGERFGISLHLVK